MALWHQLMVRQRYEVPPAGFLLQNNQDDPALQSFSFDQIKLAALECCAMYQKSQIYNHKVACGLLQ